MPVFFELTTDVFKDRFDRPSQYVGPGRAGVSSVRRPLRGLEVKEDTFAVIKVVDLLGRDIKLVDSGNPTGKAPTYTNFILQSVTDARSEKAQVTETFGDPYLFLYGQSPRFLDCAAVLLNSADFNWQAEFWENYNKYLRGTKCAEIGARLYMFYDDIVVEGYMLNAAAMSDATNPMLVQLQFRLFLTNYRNVSSVGDPRFPIRLGTDVQLNSGNTNTVSASPTSSHRGLIHDNYDEWTGTQPQPDFGSDYPEVDDLIEDAVAMAEMLAAINDIDTIQDTGLDKANTGKGTGGPTGGKQAKKPKTPKNQECTWKELVKDTIYECVDSKGYIVATRNTSVGDAKPTMTPTGSTTIPPTPPGTPKEEAEALSSLAGGSSKDKASIMSSMEKPTQSKAPAEDTSNSSTGAFTSAVVPAACDPTKQSCEVDISQELRNIENSPQ